MRILLATLRDLQAIRVCTGQKNSLVLFKMQIATDINFFIRLGQSEFSAADLRLRPKGNLCGKKLCKGCCVLFYGKEYRKIRAKLPMNNKEKFSHREAENFKLVEIFVDEFFFFYKRDL